MDYKKIAEIAELVAIWEESVTEAEHRMAQEQVNLSIARKNLVSYKKKLSELLKEE
jgi:hypothetical protein